MSGGVDSSVAAALLKKQGFDVKGVFMKLSDFSSVAQKRAKKAAKILGIPFYIFNFEKEFKKRIIDYFLREYRAGRTPNPCVFCNKEIKFGLLMQKALELGADFIATGHYARTTLKKDGIHLLKGKDKKKDQSYFLWRLSQEQLKHILFPIGNYTRAEVEKLAQVFRLPFSSVKKSMEICFVPADINDFLKKYLKPKSGNMTDRKGKVLGQHEGLCFYTVGQRKGIKLAGGPFYVFNKNLRKNRLIISKEKEDLLEKETIIRDVNWIFGNASHLPVKLTVKIRYRNKPVAAKIYKIGSKKYKISFGAPQNAITPGQSAVFYGGRELLGGGIIC